MTTGRFRRPRQAGAPDLDESPEAVHRVALYVGALIEGQKWVRRSLELKQRGKLKAAGAAVARAREFIEVMVDFERGIDMRLVDAAASRLARHTLRSWRAH